MEGPNPDEVLEVLRERGHEPLLIRWNPENGLSVVLSREPGEELARELEERFGVPVRVEVM